MSSDDVTFQIYYDGKFVVSEGNVLSYVGGIIHSLESKPEELFTNLVESVGLPMFGQRTWYKLPYEDFTELKLLYDGAENLQRMCLATKWTKAADIFIEKEDQNDNRADEDAVRRNRNDGRGEDDWAEGIGEEEEDGNDVRADDDGDDARAYDEDVENDDVGAEDDGNDDENCNSEATPPNSDGEEESNRYISYKKSSGVIRLGQTFDSIPQFKEAVVDYSLRKGFNVKFSRWGPEKSEVICAVGGGCKFRIYCSIQKAIGKYLVKTCIVDHSCIKDGYNKVVKDGVIAKLLLNDVRKNPKYRPKLMQEAVEERYNVIVSNDQCRKVKAKALATIQAEYDKQFARLKDYRLEHMDSNPESTVELGIVTAEDGVEKFGRFYLCFATLRKAWLGHCRPIIGIDGCFLKNNVKVQLLAAIGRDADNQFFPVAWAIVEVENTESWVWFIKLLKKDLELTDGAGFTLISDRQKGLLIAVEQELPKVEHRMCARHIYGNLRRVYPAKELPKELFWAAAKSFNLGDYERAMEDLKNFHQGVYEAVMQKNPHNCSRAFFTCASVCEDVSNNFSETYNKTINKAREISLVPMLETIRRQCMIRIDKRRKKALKHQGTYSEKVANSIAAEEKYRKYCQVIPCGNGHYEVAENVSQGYRVDMNAKICACRRWNMTGISCRHALKFIAMKKQKPEDYVSDWYLKPRWVSQYSEPLMGVNGMRLWRKYGEKRIQPPPRDISKGPTKKQKRIKGKNESPTKKNAKKGKEVEEPSQPKTKITREGITLHCGRCSITGHNTRKCPNVGVLTKSSSQKRASRKQTDGGPSQQSQASQISLHD